MAEELREKISEEMLSCQICFENYREPKSLPCLHTFCKGCLTTYVRKQAKADRFADYPCPICRTGFNLPSNGVEGLTTNFIYLNLADMVGQEKPKPAKKEEICECCDEKKTAVSYCEECEEKLCSSCVDAHRMVKVTRNHSIKPIPDADDAPVDKMTYDAEEIAEPSDGWLCDKHQAQKVTCICVQCVLPLCPFCISDILSSKTHSHKKHDFIGLDDALARFHSTIDSSLDQLREKVSDLEDGIDTLQETETILTESHDAVKADIGNRAKELKSAVDRWKTKLDKELQMEFQKNKEELSGKKALLESYLKTVNDGTKQVNDVIGSKDAMVLLRKEELMKKIKVLNMSVTYDANSLPQPVKFTLVGAEAGDLKEKVPGLLGSVRTEKTGRLQRADSMSSVASSVQEDTLNKLRSCCIKKWRNSTGFGFELQPRYSQDGRSCDYYVIAVQNGSSARYARLRVGDHLLEVNGVKLAGKNAEGIGKLIMSDRERVVILVADPQTEEFYRERGIAVAEEYSLCDVDYYESPDQKPTKSAKHGKPGKSRQHRSQLYAVFIGNLPRKLRISDFKTQIRDRHVNPLRVQWRGNQGHAFLQFDEFGKAQECLQLLQDFTIEEKQLKVEMSSKATAMPDNE